jgi:hypothetical protein
MTTYSSHKKKIDDRLFTKIDVEG